MFVCLFVCLFFFFFFVVVVVVVVVEYLGCLIILCGYLRIDLIYFFIFNLYVCFIFATN